MGSSSSSKSKKQAQNLSIRYPKEPTPEEVLDADLERISKLSLYDGCPAEGFYDKSNLHREAIALFSQVDLDGNRALNKVELRQAFRSGALQQVHQASGTHQRLSCSEWNTFISEMDTDGDTMISLEEFVEYYVIKTRENKCVRSNLQGCASDPCASVTTGLRPPCRAAPTSSACRCALSMLLCRARQL